MFKACLGVRSDSPNKTSLDSVTNFRWQCFDRIQVVFRGINSIHVHGTEVCNQHLAVGALPRAEILEHLWFVTVRSIDEFFGALVGVTAAQPLNPFLSYGRHV